MSFWKELKRRNVYKVGVAYAIVAWLIIQGASIIFPHLNLPSWAVTLVIVILIIGFPIALLLAWAYEMTPEGIKRTKEVPLSENITHITGKKLNYILAGLLVISVGYIVFNKYYLEPRMIATEQVPALNEAAKTKKTIAVLPFENLSSDLEQVYFVNGLSEEILNSLCQIPDLGVAGKTSSFSFKGSNKTIQEIASILGVENVLEGSVRKSGNELRITAQLVHAADGLHLWSKTYDRELKDIFAVQEDIATAVADELKATLGIGKSLKKLGGSENEKAYEYFLVAMGKLNTYRISFEGKSINESLEPVEAALELDPKFALAWALKANIHIIFADSISIVDSVASELDAALNAAKKAVELEPKLAEAHLYLGAYRRVKGDWIEAELEYRKAMELANEPLWDYAEYFLHYSAVGNFKRSLELLEAAKKNDPLNLLCRDGYIWSLFLNGDIKRAEEENERAKTLFGDKWDDHKGWLHVNLGDKVSSDEIVTYDLLVNEVAKKNLDSPKEGLAELHQIYNSTDNLTNINLKYISNWAAYFGDPDFAMDALERSYSISTSPTFFIWCPIFREVRQTPRFKEFVREIGLVDYWNKFGWSDICRPLSNGDFECE